MLIPVYIVGFILGGLVLFAVAQRVSNRKVKISLKLIGVLAGPVFFLAMIIFSGWERKKTYEMEWLTGTPAAEYLKYDKSAVKSDMGILRGLDTGSEDTLVVLRRNISKRHDCYNSFVSKQLTHYLESLPTHTVNVRYRVTYDFYLPRSWMIEQVGAFGGDNTSQNELVRGLVGFGESAWSKDRASCFSW
jgi:hypothetical protein